MIAYLKGEITHTGHNFLTLDVGGVGYLLYATEETLKALNKQKKSAFVWTHLAVRETSMDLYGFVSRGEVLFFEMLISISGIGPKSALAIMNLESIEILSSAIAKGDTTYLTKVSGIGKKIAEKIIVELRDRISADDRNGIVHQEDAEAIEALNSLGYSTKEAREALKSIPKDISGTEGRLREALKLLGNG